MLYDTNVSNVPIKFIIMNNSIPGPDLYLLVHCTIKINSFKILYSLLIKYTKMAVWRILLGLAVYLNSIVYGLDQKEWIKGEMALLYIHIIHIFNIFPARLWIIEYIQGIFCCLLELNYYLHGLNILVRTRL